MQYFFIIIDKNLFINVFKHIFFDYSEKKNRYLVIKFLETYNNIFKFYII